MPCAAPPNSTPWGDSNLYLRRSGGRREGGDLTLTVEHRAAPAMPPSAFGVLLKLLAGQSRGSVDFDRPDTAGHSQCLMIGHHFSAPAFTSTGDEIVGCSTAATLGGMPFPFNRVRVTLQRQPRRIACA
jgi:hypothetical protein